LRQRVNHLVYGKCLVRVPKDTPFRPAIQEYLKSDSKGLFHAVIAKRPRRT
jgi:hypothetical protein